MCQETLSNDYKLHNSIPSLSSLSLNPGSLWCKYKLLQVFYFQGTVTSGTTQVLSLHFAYPLKSVITRESRNSEELLFFTVVHCIPVSQVMNQTCLWNFHSGTCGLTCWSMKDSLPLFAVLVPACAASSPRTQAAWLVPSSLGRSWGVECGHRVWSQGINQKANLCQIRGACLTYSSAIGP